MNTNTKCGVAAVVVSMFIGSPSPAFKQGGAGSTKNHQDITMLGIARARLVAPDFSILKFTSSAITQIEDQNAATDNGLVDGYYDNDPTYTHFTESKYHFDAETFDQAKDLIYNARKDIINHINAGRDEDGRKLLGMTLHTIQDFYAHSNWVEKRLVDYRYPHPAWGKSDPFADIAFNGEYRPGDSSINACDADSLLAASPLTTGYYSIGMSDYPFLGFGGKDLGFWTNEWITDDRKWSKGRCVHGGDRDTHGLNKDYDARGDNYKLARTHAIDATRDFVQGILDELSQFVATKTTPDSHICRFLGQDQSLCALNGRAPSVTKISTIETSYYAAQYFTVLVEGHDLSRYLSVDIGGEANCKPPVEGSSNAFKVSCFASQGTQIIHVRESIGVSLGSLTIEVGPQNGRASTLIANVGQAISLWAENLYSTIKTVVWNVQNYVGDKIAPVTNGVAEAIQVVFSSVGTKDVLAVFKDKDDNTVGASRLQIEVKVAPAVTSVNPLTAQAGITHTFRVLGTNLPLGLSFNLPQCKGVAEVLIGTTESERKFTCTFPPGTTPGSYNGTVAVSNSPFGLPPYISFSVLVGSGISTAGLVGHWSFDTCDGRDASVNANHGAVSGSPICVAGKFGNALRFNGATDWITMPSSASFPTQAITISYWLHREGQPNPAFSNYLSKEHSFQAYMFQSGALTSGLFPGYWTEYGRYSVFIPTLTEWVHYAFTYDNATRLAKTYLNGVLVETALEPSITAVRQSPYPLYIGRNGSANVYHIKGLLDDVRLYDRALSAGEVATLTQGPDGSALVLPASAFTNGLNVAVDRQPGNVCRNGLLYNGPPYQMGTPNAATWTARVQQAGTYRLEVEMAAETSRPVNFKLNGVPTLQAVLGNTTGGWCVTDVQRVVLGSFSLQAGPNTLAFDRADVFPHFWRLILTRIGQ